MRAGFAKSFGVVLCACAVAVGGDLNPPLGAVGPTMKTIQDAHPRTPININTAPAPADNSAVHAITAPGNYYLTGNINVPAGRSAIVVDLASDPGDDPIILDLNGFSILGEAGSIDGVRFTTVFTNDRYVMTAGVPGSVISGMGGHGVSLSGVASVSLFNFGVSGCGGDGVRVFDAVTADLSRVEVSGCGGDGINATGAQAGTRTSYKSRHVVAKEVLTGRAMHVSGFTECRCDHLIASDVGGDGVLVTGSEVVRLSDVDVVNAAGWAIDIDSTGAPAADVEVEKFHVKQEFGPTQGGVRSRMGGGGGAGGGGRIAIRAGSISGTGLGGLVCEGYETAVLGALNIGSSGMDGVSMRPDGGGGGGAVAASSTRMDDIDVFGSVGDNVAFNPLATGGTHDITVSGGHFNGAGGNGFSVVPQQAGTYVFELLVTDSTMNRNGGHGWISALQSDVQMELRMSNSTTNNNIGDGVHVEAIGTPAGASSMSMTGCSSNHNSGDGTHVRWSQTGGPFVFTTQSGEMVGNAGRGAYKWWVNKKMKDSVVSHNGGHGMEMVGGTLDASGCSFGGNGTDGVHTEDTSCWIRVSQARGNSGNGFYGGATVGVAGELFVLDGSKSTDNGLNGALLDGAAPEIVNCFANGNTGNGFDLGNCTGATVQRSTASNNGGTGIWCRSTCATGSVVDNRCDNNGGGIQVDGTGMYVARCSASAGPLGGIVVAPGNNLVGPAVDAGNIATEGSPNANMNR